MARKHLRITLILGALSAIAPLSIDMYLPSLPALERHFGADAAAGERTVAAFFIGLAIGQLFYGPVADRYGRKPPLLFGLACFTLASAGCALAGSIGSLVLLRFLQAVSGCAGMVVSRAVVRDLFDHQESARMFSLLMLIMGVAPILAPLAGGYLLVWSGWRAIFWVLASFGAACVVAVAVRLPETLPPSAPRPRLRYALVEYLQLLRDRRFMGYTLSGGFAQAGMFAYISGSPFVFIDLYGVPAEHYGWLFGLNAVGIIGGAQVNRHLLGRFEPDRLLARANVVNVTCGALLLLMAWTNVLGLPGILVPLFLYIAALGFTFPNASAGAMAPFPEKAGSASALLGGLQFGVAALASLAVSALHDGTAMPMAGVIAACGLLAFATHRGLVSRQAAP
ncbi:MAG TPA: Bcr/CflA family multidrug efflux MFS transporter [Burkholderiales bacterium]|jgi:DHA1 family bicyclomycin/chloramphenicol resistance-like MFS transporter|nr:Bcr/CflA family multidrug efflux MFS transporter [Burkholderiales bacterium]